MVDFVRLRTTILTVLLFSFSLAWSIAFAGQDQTSSNKSEAKPGAEPVKMPTQTSVQTKSADPIDKIKRITPAELKEALKRNDVVVVDVRRQQQLKDGYIKGAKQIPAKDIISRADELHSDKLIVLYCSCPAEKTAVNAATQLEMMGFKRLAVLVGGYAAAAHEGIPTEGTVAEKQ